LSEKFKNSQKRLDFLKNNVYNKNNKREGGTTNETNNNFKILAKLA